MGDIAFRKRWNLPKSRPSLALILDVLDSPAEGSIEFDAQALGVLIGETRKLFNITLSDPFLDIPSQTPRYVLELRRVAAADLGLKYCECIRRMGYAHPFDDADINSIRTARLEAKLEIENPFTAGYFQAINDASGNKELQRRLFRERGIVIKDHFYDPKNEGPSLPNSKTANQKMKDLPLEYN